MTGQIATVVATSFLPVAHVLASRRHVHYFSAGWYCVFRTCAGHKADLPQPEGFVEVEPPDQTTALLCEAFCG